jgi:hypothetical protein
MSHGGYREGSGRKPGYESTLRKTSYVTKTERVPKHWDTVDIQDGLDYLSALLDQYSEEIREADAASKHGVAGPRYKRLREMVEQMRGAFPRSFFEKGRWRSIAPERLEAVQSAIAKKTRRIQKQQKKASQP